MADSKITALTAISTVDPTADPLVIVDVSDTSMAASGTTKKSTINQLLGSGGTATLASATITGDLTVDTSTLKVDSANNRVGIGTASPAAQLHVAASGSDTAVIRLAAAGGRTFEIGSTAAGYGSANNLIIYDITGSAERFRIDSTGIFTFSNVGGVAGTAMTLNSTGLGVGTSPAVLLDIQSASAVIRATSSTGTNTSFAAFGNTGGAVRVGAENSAGGGLFTGSSAYSAVLGTTGAYSAHIGTNGVVRATVDATGNVGIGVTPSAAGGCLQLKSGVTFPATQVASSDANTLDDYEEGDWTPSSTSGTNLTSIVHLSAKYTKVGRTVTLSGYFSATVTTGSTLTIATLDGLPFAVTLAQAGSVFEDVTLKTGFSQANSTDLNVFFAAGTALASGSKQFTYTITYQV